MRNYNESGEDYTKTKNIVSVVDIHRMSMDVDRDLKFALGWNRFSLGIVGIWPDPLQSKRQSQFAQLRFLTACFFMLGFIIIPQSINLMFISDNIHLLTENLVTNMPATTALIKAFVIWRQKKVLKELVGFFYNDWCTLKTLQEKAIMLQYTKVFRRISIGCMSLSAIVVILNVIRRITMIIRVPDNEPIRPFICDAYFPYNTTRNSIYILTNIGQIISGFSTVLSYTGGDGLVAMLVLHVCSQFQNLRERLKNVINNQVKKNTIEEYRNELVQIVKRHDYLNWFAKTIEKTFNIVIFIQMFSYTMLLCSQGFMVSMILLGKKSVVPMFQIIALIVFGIVVMAHLFVYCYISEMLIMQSTQIGVSAYESKWYDIPRKEAKDLLFIMYRTTVPLCLTAGNFTVFSMEMFSKVINTSIGYLSVLLTVTGPRK